MKKLMRYLVLSILFLGLLCCKKYEVINTKDPNANVENAFEQKFYTGSDLSYVNEMLDCGADYKNKTGTSTNPYQILKEAGNNLVRVRLWHDPTSWTKYSTNEDVEITIKKSKEQKMDVLLDFHYSDTWTDPDSQVIPSAWSDIVDNTEILGQRLYDYTFKTLDNLAAKELLPEIVQVGNEINTNILNSAQGAIDIDWKRNAFLLNQGIQAVRDVSKKHSARIQVMLHIAQPENAIWWFKQAKENGVINFDWIGVSYYPQWSIYQVSDISDAISTLGTTYNKKVMIVETAYPFTTENVDAAANIIKGSVYPASQKGQLEFLLDLKREVKEGNGFGMVYWEPGWVSTDCSTQFGVGSHWDNATLFDNNGNPTLGINIFNDNYTPDNTCATIWALGDGVPNALWDWNNAIELSCETNKNVVEVNLAENKFRFFQTNGDWASGLGYQYFINRGYTIDSKLKGTADNDDNFIFEGPPGIYKLEINNDNKTIVITSKVISDPYFALGDALPGGWKFDDATLLESSLFGVRKATVKLSPGNFRFFTIKNDWESKLNYAHFADNGYAIDSKLENAGDGDQNFKFIGTVGGYTLEINDNNKTISLTGVASFPSIWTVGDAVPGGWGFNGDTVEFKQALENIWEAEILLTHGGIFRFFQTFNTWDINNNYAFYAGEGYTIDAKFSQQAADDKNFMFDGTTGTYTLTINGNDKTITLN